MNQKSVNNLDNNEKYELSIIIVNWNAKKFLYECLNSIYTTTNKTKFDIWVIDNNSSDGSAEMVEKEFPEVNLICTGVNSGFAKANNIGIRKSNSRYVCLINPDVKVLNNCIDLLVSYIKQNPRIGIIGPKILNPDLTLQSSAYGFPTIWNSLIHSLGLHKTFPRSRIFRSFYRKYWPDNMTRQVDVLSGCFWVLRRKAIKKVGLLDEDFFMYREDFDFCRRMLKAGWDIVYFPEAQAIHYGGGSSSNTPISCTIESLRASITYWRKHHGEMGRLYIQLLSFIRQSLLFIQGVIYYIIKPSKRKEIIRNMEQNIAGLRWLLFGHNL